MNDWMQTYTGRVFWPLKPRAEDVNINDIAHALSNLCRFGGHSQAFYSVAQHSVLVSKIVPPKDAMWGLMHDAGEAYVNDLISPIKHTQGATWYRDAEARVMRAVCRRFGLSLKQPQSVDEADLVMLATEKRDLMWPVIRRWASLPAPRSQKVFPWSPKRAEKEFLTRAHKLGLCEVPA